MENEPKIINTESEPSPLAHQSLPQDDFHFERHLNRLFTPLRFPHELARRILTHGSHKSAASGHSARFSFIGRRVLETYLLLFIESSPSVNVNHDYDLIVSRTVNCYVLGQHVAPLWDIAQVLRWTPSVSIEKLTRAKKRLESLAKETDKSSFPAKDNLAMEEWADVAALGPELPRSVGLYKVLGETVQAIIGGIFHQFGGSVAHRVFHTRVLPHVLLPGQPEGLMDVFHEEALLASERMGGPSGPLLPRSAPTGGGQTRAEENP